jgi:predicted integral membrane protein DUF2269
MYRFVVYVHVLSAVIAVGYNATYAVWLTRGAIDRAHLLFALRGIKFMDDRIANPAYGILLITGIAQVVMSHRSWHQTWIAWALALYAALALIAFGAYSPTLKRQIAIVAEGRVDDPIYAAIDRRQTILGLVMMMIALAILALMVFRPGGA